MNKHRLFIVRELKSSLVLFFLFFFCISSCAQPQAESDFYRGLNDSAGAAGHFEKALASSNVYIKQAAAEELANLEAAGTELSAKTARMIRREASGWWAEAFKTIENPDNRKVLDLFLGFDYELIPREAGFYILKECEKKGVVLSEGELAAIEGHFAVSRLRYNEALIFFRAFIEDENWPARIPDVFFKYPVLINDLGTAFQYTSYGAEGLPLFLQWENNLTDNSEDLHYRLLFFAARIARRNGRSAQAVSLFEQALLLAPSTEQSDACIWYILDMSLNETAGSFIQKLERLIPSWHDPGYFNDIMERFLHKLASAKEWKNIIRVLNLVRDKRASMKAEYAWVIGRAIEEGFFSDEERALAAGTGTADASVFMQIAYNATENDISPAIYYRSLCAAALGLPFLETQEETKASGRNARPSPVLQFLLGFFTHDAAGHALRYIDLLEQELSVDELRAVALAMDQAGMYVQSIRLVSRYVNREGYTLDRCDLELLFPRPYREMVERQAAETGVTPEMLFALIRTESAFQSGVVSSAGAVGLTQLMPDTAQEMAGRIRRAGGPDFAASANGLDLNDPEQNIYIGAFYLNYLTGRFEDKLLSVLAYNGGINRVRRWRAASTLPADLFLETVTIYETRDYGRKVMAAEAVYEELYYRRLVSP